MDQTSFSSLVRAAEEAKLRAYAPYSGFRVGAAVLAGGQVFTGCNVENASYGLTICAERSAVFAAIGAGERAIDAVAVVSDGATPAAPCGACRQVLHEFGPGMQVIMAGASSTVVRALSELLPLAFGPEDLAAR